MLTPMNYDGAVAVVTGSASGIGRSIAHSFAARGATVVVADVDLEPARGVADEIAAAGGKAVARQIDVTDEAGVEALADFTFDAYGKVDILANNAGVAMRPFRAIWDASSADYRWMMEVNYFGVVHGIRSFVPRMLEQTGHRHIVNTSSTAPLRYITGNGVYTASKAAVDGLSNVLRAEFAELGHDFGVTILHPGPVATRVGTSERLRPEADRTFSSQVKAWNRVLPTEMPNVISPTYVGEMVAEAIERNAPYCLTHEPPVEDLTERYEAYLASHVPSQKQLHDERA